MGNSPTKPPPPPQRWQQTFRDPDAPRGVIDVPRHQVRVFIRGTPEEGIEVSAKRLSAASITDSRLLIMEMRPTRPDADSTVVVAVKRRDAWITPERMRAIVCAWITFERMGATEMTNWTDRDRPIQIGDNPRTTLRKLWAYCQQVV